MNAQTSLSVVIPVYNEQGNIRPLYDELIGVLITLPIYFEIIFVDDGSTDQSLDELIRINNSDNRVKIIQFRRNFGQTSAFAAGFDYAQGDLVLTIDADGQNDPKDIPLLYKTMQEGDFDLVSGWRVNRKETFLRKLFSSSANMIISRSTKIKIHDRGCSLKLYKREIIENIRLYGQLHRFLPELISAIGANIAEVPVNDRSRKLGKSKYGSITRTPRVILDLLTVFYLLSFFTSPMRLFGSFALLSSLLGFVIGGIMALTKIYYGITGGWEGFRNYQIGNRPLLLLAILLIIIGIQFLMMGFLGEMIMRIYYESRDKPIYHVKRVFDTVPHLSQDGVAQKYHGSLYPAHHQKGEHTSE